MTAEWRRYHVDFEDDNGLQYSMDAFLTASEATDVLEELESREGLHEIHVFRPMELTGKDALLKSINEQFGEPDEEDNDDEE
jgi:hypothetical protein